MTGIDHVPVLLKEVLDHLRVHREGLYVDCTLGLGGHALEILKNNPKAGILGFDLDERSLIKAKEKLSPYGERVTIYHSDFRYLPDLNIPFQSIKGILLDLGISSFQLDSPERGFSFNLEGPLDMRMDLRNRTTAARIIEKAPESRLARIFKEYGELKQARILARKIVALRKTERIETTTRLRRIVEDVCRWRPQKGKIHPAAKVFQALRIELNRELTDLDKFLERISQVVSPGARLAVISFHSLEDRIIKHTFARLAAGNHNHPLLRILTKKPVTPSEEEVSLNSRARSSKLRAAERV